MSNDYFNKALADEGMTGNLAALARSIFHQESRSGKNTKTSNAGAVGGMQIIPSTFNSVADKGWDINNPEHNTRAGLRYVAKMFDMAKGDPALAAAGYYGGPGGMEKARKGIAVSDPRNPNAPTTLQYGQQVAARMGGKPIQMAQASPIPVPVSPLVQSPVPQEVPTQAVAQAAPVGRVETNYVDPQADWEAIKRYMPESSPTATMANYGTQVASAMPGFIAPKMVNREIDFRAFKPTIGRA